MNSEKRKYVRFAAQDQTFAALRSGFKKVGKVHDISVMGLGFVYFGHIQEDDSEAKFSKVDIFLSDDRFHLDNIPCKVVYDLESSPSDTFGAIKICKCGLFFGKFTDDQSEQLDFFIKNYTKGILS
jgi:hypothetical protein